MRKHEKNWKFPTAQGHQDVMKIGIAKYNEECRGIVLSSALVAVVLTFHTFHYESSA